MVVPVIINISVHDGSSQGNNIILEGRGFSRNLSLYECQASGEACSVTGINGTFLNI
jgi:hypothetical protein